MGSPPPPKVVISGGLRGFAPRSLPRPGGLYGGAGSASDVRPNPLGQEGIGAPGYLNAAGGVDPLAMAAVHTSGVCAFEQQDAGKGLAAVPVHSETTTRSWTCCTHANVKPPMRRNEREAAAAKDSPSGLVFVETGPKVCYPAARPH